MVAVPICDQLGEVAEFVFHEGIEGTIELVIFIVQSYIPGLR